MSPPVALGNITYDKYNNLNPITYSKLETILLKQKTRLKSKMKKNIIQPNLSMARKNKSQKSKIETIMEDREKEADMDGQSKDIKKLEEENNILRRQIAQLQAIIELNKTNQHTDIQMIADVETSNRFERLLDIDDEEENETNKVSLLDNIKKKNEKKRKYEETAPSSSQNAQKISRKNANSENTRPETSSHINEQATSNKKTKSFKPPPIHIEHQDPKDTAKLLAEELGLSNFHIKRINAHKHILQVDSEENFSKTKELLKRAGTSYFSYTPKENKLPTFVLKGLHNTYAEDEIFKELQNLQINDITFCKVVRLHTKKSKEDNILLPIFIVQMEPESNTSKLKQIKYINYQVVNWERLIKKESTQCKRCQRLGHAASNCSMSYRCVKCNEGHGPGECKIPKMKNELNKLYCINCISYGHPASYRGCPSIIANKIKIKEKEKQNEINKQIRIRKIENYIKSGVSFAEATNQQKFKDNANSNANYQIEEDKPRANLNIEKEIYEIKLNIARFISEQQNQWLNLEKSIRNNADRIEVLTNSLLKKNGR